MLHSSHASPFHDRNTTYAICIAFCLHDAMAFHFIEHFVESNKDNIESKTELMQVRLLAGRERPVNGKQ
jgi:hypothetical protein